MRFLRPLLYIFTAIAVFLASTIVTITILINDTDSVNCPDTVGKDLSEARRIAERNGLVVVVVRYEEKKEIPFNEVISQRPEANMAVRRGRDISVVVSEGPMPVNIPDLLDQPVEMAQTILQEKAIKLKSVVYVPNPKEGKVVGQSPRTGSQILDEDGMVLFVGQKIKTYYVLSETVGVNYATLVEELDRRQIEYRLNFMQKPDLPSKAVVDSSVPARTVFGSDQVVQITVNLGG
jgi:eukaryotic-like serine/threonine-protein kinase